MPVRTLLTIAAIAALTSVGHAQQAQPTAGQSFRECRNCPEMVVVPAGSFMMGSPADEPERRENEPQRRVTIPRPFAISRTEVTWDQWEACVRDRWCDGPGVELALRTNADGTPNKAFTDWGRGTRPVIGVSWFDAQHFVGWLNWKTGGDDVYRLPSEAEWEYCCRAGTTTAYSFGAHATRQGDKGTQASLLDPYAWHTGNAAGNDPPVGALKPNPWGLYDMHGYLWEFTADDWHDSYTDAPTDGAAWTSSTGESPRIVLRGGSWKDAHPQLRSAARRSFPRDARDDAVGFRCVLAREE